MKEMVGGCCVCSDDRGWTENPLVYCDGPNCNVAVHQACYGIVTVPTGNWYCRKCESQDSTVKKCELCPSRDGALKPTDNNGWAHVVCALYIPEVRFGNVTTMEPIILQQIPPERFNKSCYICEEGGKEARAGVGACMQCNKAGCRQQFHVTCAQGLGLLCEEAGNYLDNVKYCGYCHHHYTKLKKGGNVKTIPPYRPVSTSPGASPNQQDAAKTTTKRKLRGGKTPPRASPDPGSSPRPVTPGKPIGAPPSTTSPPSGSKPGSIVVQVPLEAAMGAAAGPPPAPHAASPPSADQPSDHPAKRARSQSSDKSEKGRRSKRGSGGVKGRGNQPTPPPASHSQPAPNSSLVGTIKVQSPEEPQDPPSSQQKQKKTVIKEEKDVKILQNGVTGAPHMLGNQLNPSSTMAQKMCDTLSQEVAAHSIFSTEPNLSTTTALIPPQLPKSSSGRSWNNSSSTANSNSNSNSGTTNNNGGVTWNSSIPQSLDQLLERQWEQGSQFLMEQAQHFDIASLLSCLHQLRAENAQLEEHVNSLLARRDHLLAVNARLAIPLVPPQVSNVHTSSTSGNVGGGLAGGRPATVAPVVENGMASPAEQQYLHHRTATTRSGSSSTVVTVGVTAGAAAGSGASTSCYVTAPSSAAQSSVVVRAPDPSHHRRSVGGTTVSGTAGAATSQPTGVVYPSSVFNTQPSQVQNSQQAPVVMGRSRGDSVEAGGSGGAAKPS